MDTLFLKPLNMSIAAGWLILLVLVLRVLLKKAPKYIRCILWGIVGLRLICPFSFESVLSLIPSKETLPPEVLFSREPTIQSGVEVVDRVVNPAFTASFAPPDTLQSVNPLQVWIGLASYIWILGMVIMLVYAAFSYWRVRRKLGEAIRTEGNIWQCDHVASPFILGIFRPRIYLPSDMAEADRKYVIAHEQAHLKRKDHWWKPLAYTLLIIYWFNPLCWIAYILLCKDIELACDEKVVRTMGAPDKKAYSKALLSCSVSRRMISACPLAFGEVSVKERVKGVLHYKKPAFWISVAAVMICVVVAVCFLTNPKEPVETENTMVESDIIESAVAGQETVNSEEIEQIYTLDEAISAAILAQYKGRYPYGERLIRCESHVILDSLHVDGVRKVNSKEENYSQITAYVWALYEVYSSYGGELKVEGGASLPLALTFGVGEDGAYVLEEYWEPRIGAYYDDDIRERFPALTAEKALDSQEYIEKLKEECNAKALAYVEEYGSTDEQIAKLFADIASVPFQANAHSLQKQYATEELEKYYPATWLLLKLEAE